MKKRSSQKSRHVVAWINKAEWDQVLEYLYSKDASLQKYALHRVSAWKSRYAHNTPVAVECTADLVRCQVLDRSGQLEGHDLVLLYGTALVRFINLITERQQGRVARPLRRLAGNLNIPEWIVDLRHDFTHRKIPNLKWCRKGCKVVLDWLQQEYWSRQLGGDWESQSDEEEEGRDEVSRQKEMEAYKKARDLLISYEKEQYQGSAQGRSTWPAPFAELSWILGEMKQFALDSGDLLIDVLLEDGFLVPTLDQLETLGCNNNSPDTNPSSPHLPLVFLRFWLPLLKMLNSTAFIHLFLEKLFAELKLLFTESNDHRAYYISAWISEVIQCNSKKSEYHFETKGQRKARMKDRIFVNRIELRWQQILSACLDSPCTWTPHLVQLILSDMEHPLPTDTQDKLLRLCFIYTQTAETNMAAAKKDLPIYTLDSLHEKLQVSKRRAVKADSDRIWARDLDSELVRVLRGSPWQLCPDNASWKDCPLGRVPGQTDDPSCLMIENYSAMTASDQQGELETHSTPRAPPTVRTAEGHWNQNDVGKLKSGFKLF